MPNQIEHFITAERLLVIGADIVRGISLLADERAELDAGLDSPQWTEITNQMDELGKKAIGTWAQAQVHATLATIELGHNDQMWVASHL